jgi:hypothetical protein
LIFLFDEADLVAVRARNAAPNLSFWHVRGTDTAAAETIYQALIKVEFAAVIGLLPISGTYGWPGAGAASARRDAFRGVRMVR